MPKRISIICLMFVITTLAVFIGCTLDNDDFSSETILSGGSGTNAGSSFGSFNKTQAIYSETDDLEEAIFNEFGGSYRIADWTDFTAYGGDIGTLFDNLGVEDGEVLLVTNGGERFHTSMRHYILVRGTPHSGASVYDTIGNDAWLGSWFGYQNISILAYTENNLNNNSYDPILISGAEIAAECRFTQTNAGVILSHSNGEMIVFKENQVTYIEDEDDFMSFFVEGEVVRKIVTKDYIYLFDNFENNNVDIAVINNQGEITKIRDVEFEYQSIDVRSLETSRYIDIRNLEPSDAVEAGMLAWDYIKCGSSTAAAIASHGLLSGIAIRMCSSAVIDTIKTFSENDALNTALTVGQIWIDPAGSLETILVDSAMQVGEAVEEIVQVRHGEIALASASLGLDDGKITITLTWDTSADIDLHVIDSNNERIWYRNRTSSSGGYLDVDDVNGFGPEHVYWDENPPHGEYTVIVDHYSGTSPTNYSVLIEYGDNVNIHSGILHRYEEKEVESFNY